MTEECIKRVNRRNRLNKRRAFSRKLKRLVGWIWCRHEWGWLRNIYGDEINLVSLNKVYRSYWCCEKCGRIQKRGELHTPNV